MIKLEELFNLKGNVPHPYIIKDLRGKEFDSGCVEWLSKTTFAKEDVYSANFDGEKVTVILNKYYKVLPTTEELRNLLIDSTDESWVIHNLAINYGFEAKNVLFTCYDLAERVKHIMDIYDVEMLKECEEIIGYLKKFEEGEDVPNLIYRDKKTGKYEPLDTEEKFIEMVRKEIGIDDSVENMFINEMAKNDCVAPVFENGCLTEKAYEVFEEVVFTYFNNDENRLREVLEEYRTGYVGGTK